MLETRVTLAKRLSERSELAMVFKGYHAPTITARLGEEGIVVSRRGVSDFLLRVEMTGSIARHPGSGRPSKQIDEVKETVETPCALTTRLR